MDVEFPYEIIVDFDRVARSGFVYRIVFNDAMNDWLTTYGLRLEHDYDYLLFTRVDHIDKIKTVKIVFKFKCPVQATLFKLTWG